MSRTPSVFDYWRSAMQFGMIMSEAQAVIAMRMMGMAGIWSVSPSQNTRMVTEKVHAFTKSVTTAGLVTMKGDPPARVTRAALASIRRKTRPNTRRLSSRGLKRT
ncbi:MAG: antifreeze protein [Pseudomonadota bacterium]